MIYIRPSIVTLVAGPAGSEEHERTNEPFIDGILRTFAHVGSPRHRLLRVATVRDIDLALSALFEDANQPPIRLQIIGHQLAGGLALGAIWIPDHELQQRAFKFPYYVLDTNPSALGLLAKHAGRISELMLVACNIGSATAVGHAINGRTLTYTLAELLRCAVLGADDVVSAEELDRDGRYAPLPQRRGPKGWRWVDGAPPDWIDRTPRRRDRAA